ncbi:pyridoxamine 5'-phosphate oxidase family protein [Cellulosilyticum sp. ST5]|uniref:pyridoxamine 5'-phosphate oxidase family protein n=1 Tax=unclassified Cellulosilyticum TaxID=2643091 RepID=UPI000F8F3B08|nr:pyridoxamine 5'-phosphate oxidase family protein [Cellulosilyticum sp. WCF-2]QEH70713.1 pyridoxamine 5'-phosphate oxidase family protein [Cellulosilyticum sp. WCF-2]
MVKENIFKLMNENPVFHLATMDGDQPRVRGMLLFRADEEGIIFHTASTKDLFKQVMENPKAELCFQGQGSQIRVSGILEQVNDEKLKNEIFNHPSRKFLQAWKENGIDVLLQIFCLKNGTAVEWTMATNFEEKKPISL